MAPTFVGAGAAGATTVTVPTHQAGDLLVIVAVKQTGDTIPSLPAGWTSSSTSTTNYWGRRIGWKIAASSSETSGTWTNADLLWVAVWRGSTGLGASASNASWSSNIGHPALTIASTSWVGVLSSGADPPVVTGTVSRWLTSTDRIGDTNGAPGTWTAKSGQLLLAASFEILTPAVNHPIAATIEAVSDVTATLNAEKPLSATIEAVSAVSASLGVQPGGLSAQVDAVSSVTVSLGVLAGLSAQVDAVSTVTAQVNLAAELAATVDVVSGVSVDVDLVEIRIIRPPARTIAELVGSSTIRRDHIIILDGPRAGESLPIVGGELLLDETADVHATGSLELPPEPWVRDYINPLRTRVELQVVLALEGDDGTVHEWPRAIVHATDMPVQVSADGGFSLSVQVADRADWVSKRGMDEPYAGSGSLSLMSHVVALVARYAPWLPVGDLSDPGYRSGTDLLVGAVGEDAWEHAVQLAWTAGQRLFVDAAGRLSSRPVLAPEAEVARWVEGEDDCLIADLSTAMSDADVCNRLGVPWEELEPEDAPEGWTPKGGWEWWEDAAGPLGTSGPLGVRARAYSGDASVIHSPAHARDVAMSHGLSQQGVQLPLDFVVLADPRRDVGDVIKVTRAKLDVDELARVQTLRFQLGAALMSGSMGARRML